jgi:nitroreductase
MDFKNLVSKRYSFRDFSEREVEQIKLDYIFECVRMAPSAVNIQPVKFLVVQDKTMLEAVKSCYPRDWMRPVNVCVVACGNRSEAWCRSDGKNHTDIDVAIAVDHLTLAAAEQGLGTCWVCNFDAKRCAEVLSLTDEIEPVALIPIGYATDNKKDIAKKRKSVDEIVSYI